MKYGGQHALAPQRANAVDRVIGARIEARRIELGMDRQILADALEVTDEQIRKYERGTSRVAASALLSLSRVLKTPIAALLPGHGASAAGSPLAGASEPLLHEIVHAALVLDSEGRTRLLASARALQPQHSAHKRRPKT